MKRMFITGALCAAVGALCAVATAAVAEPVKLTLTYAEISDLESGLSQLNGYQQVVNEGTQKRIVPTPYTFTYGVWDAIGRDLVKTRAVKKAAQEELRAFAEPWGDAARLIGTDKCDADAACTADRPLWERKLRDIEAAPHEIILDTIVKADLDIRHNPQITPGVEVLLKPIIADFDPPATPAATAK